MGNLKRIIAHTEIVSCVAVSPDGFYVYIAYKNGALKKFVIETGEEFSLRDPVIDIDPHSIVSQISVSQNNRNIIVVIQDKLFLLDTIANTWTLIKDNSTITAVIITMDGKYVVFVNNEKSILVWDINDKKILHQKDFENSV